MANVTATERVAVEAMAITRPGKYLPKVEWPKFIIKPVISSIILRYATSDTAESCRASATSDAKQPV